MIGRPTISMTTISRRQVWAMYKWLYGDPYARFRHNSEDLAAWNRLIRRQPKPLTKSPA